MDHFYQKNKNKIKTSTQQFTLLSDYQLLKTLILNFADRLYYARYYVLLFLIVVEERC